MWPFTEKEKPVRSYVMFDIDKVLQLNHLSPIQIVELICASQQTQPHRVVFLDMTEQDYKTKYPNICDILRVHKI